MDEHLNEEVNDSIGQQESSNTITPFQVVASHNKQKIEKNGKNEKCILEIEKGNRSRDSTVISLFFFMILVFIGANGILRSESQSNESIIFFDTHCQLNLKHVSFYLTRISTKISPLKITISFRMSNSLIRSSYNISFDSAITHTNGNQSYIMNRYIYPYSIIKTSKPGVVADPITIFDGFVTQYDELFVSISMRGDVQDFDSLLVKTYQDTSLYSTIAFAFNITSFTCLLLNFVFLTVNYLKNKKFLVPNEFKLTYALSAIGTISFVSLFFDDTTFVSESLITIFSCICRAAAIWHIVRQFSEKSKEIDIIIVLISSAISAVEISETTVIYAPVIELARLQFPLIIVYDIALLIAIVLAYVSLNLKNSYTDEKRHKFIVYSLAALMLGCTSTFVAVRLSNQKYSRMRNITYLFKRAVAFGFAGCISSFHTIVGTEEIEDNEE